MTVAIGPLVRTEFALQWRHGVALTTGLLTALWAVVLLLTPSTWRAEVLAWLLLLDLGTLGLYFAPALVLLERANGVAAAVRLSRLRPSVGVAVRLALLAAFALAATLVLVPIARPASWLAVLGGALLTATFFSALSLVALGRATALTTYLVRVPLLATPLLVPTLLRAAGLVDAPWTAISPVTGAWELLRGEPSWWHLCWLTTATVVVAGVAARLVPRLPPDAPPAWGSGRAGRLRVIPGAAAWRSHARLDLGTLASDRLLLLVAAGVPVLAASLRLATGPGLTWLEQRHGVEAGGAIPALWAFVLVLHVPLMVGAVAGLLFLEDRDVGILPALATTSAGLPSLVRYRVVSTVVGGALLVMVSAWIAGAHHQLGLPGLVLSALAGGALAPLPAVLLFAFARDRVGGVAILKAIGVPLYAPVAWWFVDAPAGWLFALLPTAWVARTFWSDSLVEAAGFALGAVLFVGLLAAVLRPRLSDRAVGLTS